MAIASISNAYGTIEIVGEVLILPLTVQPPASGTLVNLITPLESFVGMFPGPQLPIGEVKETFRITTFVAVLATAFQGNPPSPTLVQPTWPVNEPLVIYPTPAAVVFPVKFAVQGSVMPFLVADVLPVPVKFVLVGMRW